MLFNSVEFLFFLVVVFGLYWSTAKKRTAQNSMLLIASYFFYSWWDWRFLPLLVFSTFLDFFAGLQIQKSVKNSTRKRWLIISIAANIVFLGYFKYCNFFIDNIFDTLASIGVKANKPILDIVLPVGISFYTFHGLSYIIDVYYKRSEATKNFIDYALFVNFFPLLIAGPIERAHHLLVQIKADRIFNSDVAKDGLRQILWGLFKKVVIADTLSMYVDETFENFHNLKASQLALGAVYFSFQIYCDFSGYSDMALGIAKLFGFRLLKNFSYPYFSRDIAEFWRKWHMSLTSWFRDYVYIPLGGSRVGPFLALRNTFIIFLISGFWHGASWTFVAWGLLHALYYVPLQLSGATRKNLETISNGRWFPNLKEVLQITSTFTLVTIAWIFFRANTITDAFEYISHIFRPDLFSLPSKLEGLPLIFVLLSLEWFARANEHALTKVSANIAVRWATYLVLCFFVLDYMEIKKSFIYFQF